LVDVDEVEVELDERRRDADVADEAEVVEEEVAVFVGFVTSL